MRKYIEHKFTGIPDTGWGFLCGVLGAWDNSTDIIPLVKERKKDMQVEKSLLKEFITNY